MIFQIVASALMAIFYGCYFVKLFKQMKSEYLNYKKSVNRYIGRKKPKS
ncbi:MAG: hypothetical protein IJO48_04595 [Clostridia bacterium]|nr:hypothetical protein [Clostridia bacterium]